MRKVDVIKNEYEYRELYECNGKEVREFTKTLRYGSYKICPNSYWHPDYTERYSTFEVEVDVKNRTYFIS